MQKQGNWKTLLLNITKKKKIHLSKKVTPNIYIYIRDKYLLKKKKILCAKKAQRSWKVQAGKRKEQKISYKRGELKDVLGNFFSFMKIYNEKFYSLSIKYG